MEQIDWLKEYSNTFTTNKPLNFQLIKDKLESQKTTLASFMHYLGNIIKSIDDNNYNSIMIDELCKMIQEYYAKNTNTDSEESTSKTSESSGVQFCIKKEDSKEESKEDSKDESSDEEDEEESPAKKTTSEVINGDEIYDSFINNKHNVNNIFTKPNYDIVNNLRTFITASNKY
jgi:hypothetical protein